MIKKCAYCILCILAPFVAQSTNDIAKLDATLHDFGSIFLPNYSGTARIDDYIIQLPEMKQFAGTSYDSIFVLKTYTLQTDKTKNTVEYVKQQTTHFRNVRSFDTLTRKMGAHTYLMAAIVYDVASDVADVQQKRRLYAKFVMVGSTLRLWGKVQVMTDREFFDTELTEIYDDRLSIYNKKYRDTGIAHEDTIYNMLPYRKKNKWGLQYISTGTIAIEPQFDSLYAFRNGVALVKKASQYNLLKPDGSYVLPQWNKHIYCVQTEQSYTYWKYTSAKEYTRIELPEIVQNNANIQEYNNHYYGNKNIIVQILDEPCHPHHFTLYNKATQQTVAEFTQFELFERMGDFFFASSQDSSVVIDSTGTIMLTATDICKPIFPGYLLIFNRTTRTFGVYCPYTQVYFKPTHWFVLPIKRDAYFITLNNTYDIHYISYVKYDKGTH